jgi:diguanylate cyclase (GGDEF)-like protein
MDVLEEQGDLPGAFAHSRAYIRLYRNVYAQEHEDKVRALEVLHRTHLAEHRAEAETKKNGELRASLGELDRLNQQAIEVGFTDELTGLRNRRYLMMHVMNKLQETPFALAVLDLDHFKRINDTYGHDGGDRVLKEFAGLLQTQVREGDIVTRIGGEEFVVIFPTTDLTKAHLVLTRLLEIMQTHPWAPLGPTEYVTFTAGLTECLGGNLKNALREADALLYVGKTQGRNGIWPNKPHDKLRP